MADQVPDFIDGDTSISNRVKAAWLIDVNALIYRGTWAPTHNTVDLATSARAPRTGYFGTSIIAPILDSGSGTLVLKGAGVTALTVTGANAVFAGTLVATTSLASPIIDSGGAVTLSLKTNNGTEQVQITHTASAARSITLTGSAAGNPAISVTGGNLAFSSAVNFVSKLFPSTDALASQTAAGLHAGTGVPNNANGNNGDFYFRSDGGAGSCIYQKRAGAWAATGA